MKQNLKMILSRKAAGLKRKSFCPKDLSKYKIFEGKRLKRKAGTMADKRFTDASPNIFL
jgi:hypothetical protein